MHGTVGEYVPVLVSIHVVLQFFRGVGRATSGVSFAVTIGILIWKAKGLLAFIISQQEISETEHIALGKSCISGWETDLDPWIAIVVQTTNGKRGNVLVH